VFRRRSHASDEQIDAEGGQPGEAVDTSRPPVGDPTGPWDVAQLDGQGDAQRIDFGALLIPALDGMQLRVELGEDQQVVAITVLLGETSLQLQAFAAPRGEGIWDDVRQEIAEGIRGSQGMAREADGPFGRELRAEVPLEGMTGSASRQVVRFIGADGPRWFLRGLISGAGGADPTEAGPVEEIFRGVAVRRGDHAAAPREPLPLTVPNDSGLLSEEPPADGG